MDAWKRRNAGFDEGINIMPASSLDEVNTIVAELIDHWCERRSLVALRCVLEGWPHNGLTDGLAELADALRSVRALARSELLDTEVDAVSRAIALLDQAVYRR